MPAIPRTNALTPWLSPPARPSARVSAGLLTILGLLLGPAHAQEMVVAPYLQTAQPTSIWVAWETSSGDESLVEFGPTEALGQLAQGDAFAGEGEQRHHEVQLTGLRPDTRYHYRVQTGALVGEVHHFQTPPAFDAEARTRLVAMSDMQQDHAHPDRFRQIVEEGVIPVAQAQFDPDLARALNLVLVPGDLVENGQRYGQWADQFFGPAARLLRHVPVYPVLGNHENNAPAYFDYFHLPENGTPGFDEHWWWFDQSNLRVIGLDSNTLFRLPLQLEWLDAVLADACAADHVDFVFAQLHHPHHSELWPAGNADYTGAVIERLGHFSTDCGKPSVHFYGHTHGYSRGHDADHQHVMVNVASAGGNLDFWGEYPQTNYPEHTVSQDDYGFVFVEVEAGDDPRFRLQRFSQGQPEAPLDNVLRDTLEIRAKGLAPETPRDAAPLGEAVDPNCFTIGITPFVDPDGDTHQATQWQIGAVADGACQFDPPVRNVWRQAQDWYANEDLQAGDTLTDEVVERLEPEQAYCWRARVRDTNLQWSGWSAPARFRTGPASVEVLPLRNPGAEEGTAHWRVEAGVFEALENGACNSGDPFAGDHHFAVGGVCEASALGRVSQRVDLSAHAAALDAGILALRFGGQLRDYNGRDRPDLWLRFIDAAGAVLTETPPIGAQRGRWTPVDGHALAPEGTRAVELVLRGQRNAGTDNDSYFDDLYLALAPPQACDDLPDPPPPEPDQGVADAGPRDAGPADQGLLDAAPGPDAMAPVRSTASDGCRGAPGPAALWSLLLLAGLTRRRR